MKLGAGNYTADMLNYYMAVYSEWLGLPTDTLMSIATEESSYDPDTGSFRNICNRSGACGLMQLKPIALQDIYNKFRISIDPSDPIQSIVGAALLFYLNRAYIRYFAKIDPDPASLIVAYTGGWKQGYNYLTGNKVNNTSLAYLNNVGGRIGVA